MLVKTVLDNQTLIPLCKYKILIKLSGAGSKLPCPERVPLPAHNLSIALNADYIENFSEKLYQTQSFLFVVS